MNTPYDVYLGAKNKFDNTSATLREKAIAYLILLLTATGIDRLDISPIMTHPVNTSMKSTSFYPPFRRIEKIFLLKLNK